MSNGNETKNVYEAIGVSRGFSIPGGDTFMALNDVSLTIPEGKLTVLKGKSGSGKTTLINLLGALDRPTKGKIIFGGNDIASISDAKREKIRRDKIGFVFQSVSLIPVMSVYENVEFALRLAKASGDHDKRVKECLAMVGLEKRIKHMPQELSGGEQQRVAIARAMAHNPRVIIADEPTAELDSVTARNVVNLFRKLVEQQGVSILMTTHDMALMDAGDVIYTLEEGRLING